MAGEDRGREADAGRAARWLTGALAVLLFCVALAETLRLTIRGLDHFDVRTPTVELNLVPVLLGGLDGLRTARAASDASQLVFLGDSITISTGEGLRTIPQALRAALAARGARGGAREITVHSLAALGAGPFDYYFFVDELIAAKPDGVILAFSLQSLGESFRALSREGLSGWISPARLLDVLFAPTHWIDLSADELLSDVAIVQLGGGELWRQILVEQARLGVARSRVSDWLGERFGGGGPQAFELARFSDERKRLQVPGRDRYRAEAERQHYGALLDDRSGARLDEDHPVLVVLGKTLRELQQAGIPVLVAVNPVNVEHLCSLGLADDDRLRRGLGAIERVVQDSGGTYLDLHALLPDAAFRDAAGHLGTDAHPGATDQVAAVLAPAVEALAARPRTSARSEASGRR